MKGKCPLCNKEHEDLLSNLTGEASDIAMKFTETSFDKIWNEGMAGQMAKQMNSDVMAKIMFHTGATQMLVKYLMDEYKKTLN